MYPLSYLPEYYPILSEWDKGFIGYLINKDPHNYYFIPTDERNTFIIVDKRNKNAEKSLVGFSE
jgi:hypothetical protein